MKPPEKTPEEVWSNPPRALVADVRRLRAFRAFSHALAVRVKTGRAFEAMEVLKAVGAPASVAFEIVDGWPTRGTAKLARAGFTLREEAAVRLACYIEGGIARYDWEAIGRRAGVARFGRPADAGI